MCAGGGGPPLPRTALGRAPLSTESPPGSAARGHPPGATAQGRPAHGWGQGEKEQDQTRRGTYSCVPFARTDATAAPWPRAAERGPSRGTWPKSRGTRAKSPPLPCQTAMGACPGVTKVSAQPPAGRLCRTLPNAPLARVGGGLVGIMTMSSMGRTSWYGGLPSAISMQVMPSDQMSARWSYLSRHERPGC